MVAKNLLHEQAHAYKIYAKKSKLYVVINYKSVDGKFKKKWIATGLDISAKKKEINDAAQQLATEFFESIANTGAEIVGKKKKLKATGQHDISDVCGRKNL